MKYTFKTKPYRHQVKALRKLIDNGYGGALLMEPRTGKSKVAVDYISMLNQAGKLDRVVIICPSRVMDVWIDQFHVHCPRRFHTIVWDKDERKKELSPISSRHDLTVLIVNYEAFATPGPKLKSGRRSKKSGRFKTRQKLLKWLDGQPAAIVVDESHKIKSPSGKSSNMIVGLHKHFKYRLILTGTPITKAKRAFDIYMQWNLLNPERFSDLPTVSDFKEHYGKWTQRNGYPQWLGGRNLKQLQERIHQDAYAVKRDECFDLPPRDDQVIKVPLKKSAKVYDDLAEHMVAEIEELKDLTSIPKQERSKSTEKQIHTIEASIKLVLNLRLSQITGGCATSDEGQVVRVGSEKLTVLRELLTDYFENEEKVVVAARFKSDLRGIQLMGKEFDVPTYRLSGGVKREQSTQDIKEFSNTDGPALYAVQPSAGSLGIDLSASARMVWYSLTPSYVDFTQCCDRIALSRRSTTFTYLLAQSTVDEVLYNVLQEDKDLTSSIIEQPGQILRKD